MPKFGIATSNSMHTLSDPKCYQRSHARKHAEYDFNIQGVSENTDTFVLSIVTMLLPVVSCDKRIKIASSMEIC